jgi:hypothetical protein
MRTLLMLCLALAPLFLSSQTLTYRDGKLSLDRVPPIANAPGASRPARWHYYWEFGDGYYCESEEPSIAHAYERSGATWAKVWLTPLYSNSPHCYVENSVNVTGTGRAPQRCGKAYPIDKNNFTGITSNAGQELVPGSEIQVIVHYRVPANATGPANGRLVIGYNNPQEKGSLKFAPLIFERTDPKNYRLHGAGLMASGDVSRAKACVGDGDYIFIDCPDKLAPGTERWLMLTFRANKLLDSTIVKKRGKLQFGIRAAWLPNTGNQVYCDEHRLTMLPVHDPNRIRVDPSMAYFKKNRPTQLEYFVEFQNEAAGYVEQLDIELPVDPKVNPVNILVKSMHPFCPSKPPGYKPAVEGEAYFTCDNSKLQQTGKVNFQFHNVKIPGKRTEGVPNRFSKGFVQFSVPSTNRREAATASQAIIRFKGADPIRTNTARTRWRYRTAGLKVGYALTTNLNGYTNTAEGIDRLTAGFSWINAPLKSGLGYGWDISYVPFSMLGRRATPTTINIDLAGGILSEENLLLRNLDLTAHVRYQFGGFLAVGGNAGITAPLRATSTTTSRFFRNSLLSQFKVPSFVEISANGTDPDAAFRAVANIPADAVKPSTNVATFGWVQAKQPVDSTQNVPPPQARRSIGGVASVLLEAGRLGDAVIGVRQDIRYLANAYKTANWTFGTTEVYLRFKLVAIK